VFILEFADNFLVRNLLYVIPVTRHQKARGIRECVRIMNTDSPYVAEPIVLFESLTLCAETLV